MNWLYIVIAALSGSAMALQGTFNAVLGKIVGIWQSTLLVHVIGTLSVTLIIILIGRGFEGLDKIGSVPWYAFLGGILNVLIIYAVVRSIPEIGVGNVTTAIIVAQILTAVAIDSTGAFGMDKYDFKYIDLLGILFLALGTRILLLD